METQQIFNTLAAMVDAVETGAVRPLEVFAELSKIEKLAKEAKEQVRGAALAEAAYYPEKQIPIAGVIVEKKAAAGRWDFKGIRAWSETKERLAAIEEQAKAAYQASQKFSSHMATADGEEVELPIYTAGGETLAVKI